MQIRRRIKSYKGAFLSGKVFKRMEKGNYRGAAIILMETATINWVNNTLQFIGYQSLVPYIRRALSPKQVRDTENVIGMLSNYIAGF